MSDGPPTRYHRITKPDFRPCSTCRSRSQAPFCLCTLRTISDRAEGTFGRLRYILGGDRPSHTAHLTMSCHQLHGIQLELQYYQGGIPTTTPPKLTLWFPSLPPILYRQYRNSMLSYSKEVGGQAVLGRQSAYATPWLTVRHGYDPTYPVRTSILSGWYPNNDSTKADALVSQSPTYPVQTIPKFNAKLQ